jgi:FkbM family methyltransferase
MSRWRAALRETFRWYLRRFPLRDGKGYLYDKLHPILVPEERFVAARLVRGFSLELDLKDPDQRRMYFYGDYDERYEADMVPRLLEAGEVFWDIGANIGFFTLLAATVLNHTGEVVAFEPGRQAYQRLERNLSLNPYKNIHLHKVAVADREGEAVLHLSADLADGRASLYASGATGPNQPLQQSCHTVSLDDYGERLGLHPPHFVKIDVEGAEPLVLRGARQMLQRDCPLLLVEMKETALRAGGSGREEIQDFLQGFGYLAVSPHRGKYHVVREVGSLRSRNVLWFVPSRASHREKISRLPVTGDF